MQSNLSKQLAKIFSEIYGLDNFTKTMIKYGTSICLALLILGTAMIYLNHAGVNYDSYFEFTAISVIKSSFTVLAEVIIGCMLVDYFFKKR